MGLTHTGALLGTTTYLAPEQMAGTRGPALGPLFPRLVLYEMLTGVKPFRGEDIPELTFKVANLAARPPSHLVPHLAPVIDFIIARALKKKPEERYANATELANDLWNAVPEVKAAEAAGRERAAAGTVPDSTHRARKGRPRNPAPRCRARNQVELRLAALRLGRGARAPGGAARGSRAGEIARRLDGAGAPPRSAWIARAWRWRWPTSSRSPWRWRSSSSDRRGLTSRRRAGKSSDASRIRRSLARGGSIMRNFQFARFAAAALALLAGTSFADWRAAPVRIDAESFATLPKGVRYPEGIAADPATGDLYVGTFDSDIAHANKLVRLARNGKVLAQKDFGSTPLLGLAFAGGKVYILNFGASKLQRIAAAFDASTPVEDVAALPGIGAPAARTVANPDGSSDTLTFGSSGFAGPNAMTFDHAGDLYISDSFQGAIFEVADATHCAPCTVSVLAHDALATAGFPPFGANGLALSADERTLYVANTGDNRVLKMDIATGTLDVFAESLHGADGLLYENGRLWVAANQADEVVALNASGRVVARAGEFEGIGRDGAPRGLLFPASLTILDGWMYVTNLALPLTPPRTTSPRRTCRAGTSRASGSRARQDPSDQRSRAGTTFGAAMVPMTYAV